MHAHIYYLRFFSCLSNKLKIILDWQPSRPVCSEFRAKGLCPLILWIDTRDVVSFGLSYFVRKFVFTIDSHATKLCYYIILIIYNEVMLLQKKKKKINNLILNSLQYIFTLNSNLNNYQWWRQQKIYKYKCYW